MGVAATLFAVQQIKRIEQRRSGAAQWLPGPRSIGQNEFLLRTITFGVGYYPLLLLVRTEIFRLFQG